LFILIAGKAAVMSSLRDFESFQDSGNLPHFLHQLV